MSKQYFWFISLLITAVCWWIFSSLWVSRTINQQAQHLSDSLETANASFEWSFDNLQADVVSQYWPHWLQKNDSIISQVDSPILSLRLKSHFSAAWFSKMYLDILSENSAVMTISITNDQPDTFYYAYDVPVYSGKHEYDLSQLIWTKRYVDNEKAEQVKWHDIQSVSTLILRFSQQKPLTINHLTIHQNNSVKLANGMALNCHPSIVEEVSDNSIYTVNCFWTNPMVFLHQQINLKKPNVVLTVNNPIKSELWLWGIGAMLFFLLTLGQLSLRILSVLSIWGILCCIVLFLWVVNYSDIWLTHRWTHWYTWVLLVLCAAIIFSTRETLYSIFRTQSHKGWIVVMLPTAILFIILSIYGAINYQVFLLSLPVYLLWALFQQVILCAVASKTLYQCVPKNSLSVALIVGLLFAVLHTPNNTLMLATWISGTYWCWAWLKYKSLLPNVLSHAFLALAFYQTVPDFYLHSARIGIRFIG